jgi:CBS-domain-containing membrane protein
MLAAVIAIVLTIGVAPVLRASHPPAAATTLLVALGSLKTLNDAIMVTIGVLIIAVVGEGLRQVRLGQMRLDPPKQEARRPAPMPWLQRR